MHLQSNFYLHWHFHLILNSCRRGCFLLLASAPPCWSSAFDCFLLLLCSSSFPSSFSCWLLFDGGNGEGGGSCGGGEPPSLLWASHLLSEPSHTPHVSNPNSQDNASLADGLVLCTTAQDSMNLLWSCSFSATIKIMRFITCMHVTKQTKKCAFRSYHFPIMEIKQKKKRSMAFKFNKCLSSLGTQTLKISFQPSGTMKEVETPCQATAYGLMYGVLTYNHSVWSLYMMHNTCFYVLVSYVMEFGIPLAFFSLVKYAQCRMIKWWVCVVGLWCADQIECYYFFFLSRQVLVYIVQYGMSVQYSRSYSKFCAGLTNHLTSCDTPFFFRLTHFYAGIDSMGHPAMPQ